MKTLSEFKRRTNMLVCVDSDGCAMDTMDIKHFRCFGPCMVEEWCLERWQEEILARWNEINLYTVTRGINRFKGLSLALSEINEKYCPIEGVELLKEWTNSAPELSGGALAKVIEKRPQDKIFEKALNWSKKVNDAINSLPNENKLPFPMAKEGLKAAHRIADVAIVSSANLDAVLEEWEMYGLMEHVDVVTSQNDGSKSYCISELIKKGYNNINVVMCGDAPGDLDAAGRNGIYFFPILVGKEKASWEEFISEGLGRLADGCYGGDYQEKKIEEFYKNLGK